MGGSRASCRRWGTRPAALGAWLGIAAIDGHSGEVAPRAGAAPRGLPPAPAPGDANVQLPITERLPRLAQPGFNEGRGMRLVIRCRSPAPSQKPTDYRGVCLVSMKASWA